ncbi:uncharacterized protein LOC111696732 isoform X3 [Eurytemora carolleeae]|uniref:uncharacterized protein LOC111696732 isoform X3 n=1 Tax=Eurytemora carolleeae TaxID=1294199 RepID=UPI000C76D57C|nr:uncharacterized protein LOC111696732 isoform X3 [Eurytemora carolleeae]|eukprot:XP_023322216.1 uncharacterized protein LOC111696732 isoform X3 [Eurytemora affinis]
MLIVLAFLFIFSPTMALSAKQLTTNQRLNISDENMPSSMEVYPTTENAKLEYQIQMNRDLVEPKRNVDRIYTLEDYIEDATKKRLYIQNYTKTVEEYFDEDSLPQLWENKLGSFEASSGIDMSGSAVSESGSITSPDWFQKGESNINEKCSPPCTGTEVCMEQAEKYKCRLQNGPVQKVLREPQTEKNGSVKNEICKQILIFIVLMDYI